MSESYAEQKAPASTNDNEPIVVDQLLSNKFLRSNICHIAGNLMADDDLIIIKSIGDKKYRVSKGNEHFMFSNKGIASYSNPDSDISGFQLFQEVSKKDQTAREILIVRDGVVKNPLARILTGSESLNAGLGIDMLEDPKAINDCLTIVASIDKDSREKNLTESHARKMKRRKILRRTIGALVATATISTIGWFGYNEGSEYISEKTEQEARDRQERENEIAEFDRKFDIESDTLISNQEIQSVEFSDQFLDQVVPGYNDRSVSQDISMNLSEPRSLDLDLDDEGCQLIDIELGSGMEYKVIHDGDPNKLYNILLDARENLITLCNSKNFPGQSTLKEADRLVIQEAPSVE